MAVINVDNQAIEYVIVLNTIFFRIWRSDDGDDPCGVLKSSTTTTFIPIFVKILCNDTPQEALINTG
jgi:hypothetical protein